MYQKAKKCGDCALCIHSYQGCECSLNDKRVEYNQTACEDYIDEN